MSCLRSLEGGIVIPSRYFAIVLRATWIPCSASNCASLQSLSGFLRFSEAISFLISARMAVAEHSPPSSVPTWLEKKYFSSKVPRGVCKYFCVATRVLQLQTAIVRAHHAIRTLARPEDYRATVSSRVAILPLNHKISAGGVHICANASTSS